MTKQKAAPEGAVTEVENEEGYIVLGKRRRTWKPGTRPLTGFLIGMGAVQKKNGKLARTFLFRLTETTTVMEWDPETKEEEADESIPNEQVQVFVTKGLEDLYPYVRNDSRGVYKVKLPIGKKVPSGEGEFWDMKPIRVSEKPVPRTAYDAVERAPVALPPTDTAVQAPSGGPRQVSPESLGFPTVEDGDIPF